MAYHYESNFSPSEYIKNSVLRSGRICAVGESPQAMVSRVAYALYKAERRYVNEQEAKTFADSIGQLMDASNIVFSTPIMTNAGRHDFVRPLSACTVPPVSLSGSWDQIKTMVDAYHAEAMGTGFSFTDVDDPVETLMHLNDIAVKGVLSGREDRPVGNMGICHISHPKIADFVRAKFAHPDIDWKFNVSVDVPETFWESVLSGDLWRLSNGTKLYSGDLLDLIVSAAHECADPGLVYMDRINRDNPIPGAGAYQSVAPCAEVGLVPGETCQFGYVNLGALVKGGAFDHEKLIEIVVVLTKALDNCLDISQESYQVYESRRIVGLRRKIGIGICGLADMFIRLGIPYGSEPARVLARDIVALINLASKKASHELAVKRGSFEAMSEEYGCEYLDTPTYLERRYGKEETKWVSPDDWAELGARIRTTRCMRNSTTIALPPTGRSALVIDASTGVEPLFSLKSADGSTNKAVQSVLNKDEKGKDLSVSGLLLTSTHIAPMDHLLMVASLQTVVDDSISKTINLPAESTVGDVKGIYQASHELGLKGITMYREGTARLQPVKLK
jgi:ribonucleoside-diphosphate reductase alpha chain